MRMIDDDGKDDDDYDDDLMLSGKRALPVRSLMVAASASPGKRYTWWWWCSRMIMIMIMIMMMVMMWLGWWWLCGEDDDSDDITIAIVMIITAQAMITCHHDIIILIITIGNHPPPFFHRRWLRVASWRFYAASIVLSVIINPILFLFWSQSSPPWHHNEDHNSVVPDRILPLAAHLQRQPIHLSTTLPPCSLLFYPATILITIVFSSPSSSLCRQHWQLSSQSLPLSHYHHHHYSHHRHRHHSTVGPNHQQLYHQYYRQYVDDMN